MYTSGGMVTFFAINAFIEAAQASALSDKILRGANNLACSANAHSASNADLALLSPLAAKASACRRALAWRSQPYDRPLPPMIVFCSMSLCVSRQQRKGFLRRTIAVWVGHAHGITKKSVVADGNPHQVATKRP